MNDGEETRRENQQSQGHADTALPTTPAPNPKQPHGEDIHGGANGEPQDSKKWFRNADWWMVIVTAAGFFVGFITLVVFYSQFKEMKTQTGILNDQATQAAKDSSESSRKVERQLKIAKQQADAADNNVKVIQWQFRQDQRAWVGPEQVVHSKLSEGKPSFGVILRNTGKTPALEFKDGIMVMPFKKGQQFKPFYYEGAHECATEREPHSVRVKIKSKWTGTSISSLFPQQIHTPFLRDDAGSLPSAEQLKAGDPILYIYGWASYTDAFGQPHCTHFCSHLATDLENAYTCDTYNDAD